MGWLKSGDTENWSPTLLDTKRSLPAINANMASLTSRLCTSNINRITDLSKAGAAAQSYYKGCQQPNGSSIPLHFVLWKKGKKN
jgi:hypothetical protein